MLLRSQYNYCHEYKGYNARQFIAEFPDKIWMKNCIKRLLVKLRNGATLTGSVTRNFRHFRWCNLGQMSNCNCNCWLPLSVDDCALLAVVLIWRQKTLSGSVLGGSVFSSVERCHSSLLYHSVHFQSPFQVVYAHLQLSVIVDLLEFIVSSGLLLNILLYFLT